MTSTKHPSTAMDRFISLREVEHRVGLKKSAIYSRIRDGQFPAPKKLGVNCSRWLESAVNDWMQAHSAPAE